MDLGNYELGATQYTAPAPYVQADPSKSKLKGLMNTDYDQLKNDLSSPGALDINRVLNQQKNQSRDMLGGQGLYGSSIQADVGADIEERRANALAANSAMAGSTVAQLKSQENQWLGNAALQEAAMQNPYNLDSARMKNTWDLSQDQMNKNLIHDILMGSLGNKWNLDAINKSGGYNLDYAKYQNRANDKKALWGGLGDLAGGLMGSFF